MSGNIGKRTDAEIANYMAVKDGRKSRWFELFGTAEKAARTLAGICESCRYGDCVTCGVPEWADYSHDYDSLLEWLRGDA